MPHYKDGTEAKVGDFVVGKGYNVKDAEGELAVIAGTLIHITPDAAACNVQVAYWRTWAAPTSGPVDLVAGQKYLPGGYIAAAGVEYGQADHFEKASCD